MTIEERDTARAIQTIARELKRPSEPAPIDWEQRRYEIAKGVAAMAYVNNCDIERCAADAVRVADALIASLKSQTDKPE